MAWNVSDACQHGEVSVAVTDTSKRSCIGETRHDWYDTRDDDLDLDSPAHWGLCTDNLHHKALDRFQSGR